MEKRGNIEKGRTPCIKCGSKAGEHYHKGDVYCFSCLLKTGYQHAPVLSKEALDQQWAGAVDTTHLRGGGL